MLKAPNALQGHAREAIREYLSDVECANVDEMVEVLTVMLTRIAFLIERKTNTDTAQLALYAPYQALGNKDNNNAV